ncbi:DnaJ C-terminal domain-containing protein [Caulobacter sp. 17J80-11]|uniref:DnaJ C-terminal domain-containing protein n=1 Tax=Caulobacter sp. 17J80-11 TaxID=2763502 RepID=UPI0016536F7E|nr:DnaJ C-terminal domain-containing protein [Caulobacter sp. 17J80-11]MBC6981172.1 J domain-containing protein [Caulobacter sp. 17J80-11]
MTAQEARTLLGLPASASREATAAAFRTAAKAARPDQGGDPERFRQVIEAYRTLQRLDDARATVARATAAAAEPACEALEITPREAYAGLARNIRLPNGRKLGLRLPGGLRNGAPVRLKGQATGGEDLFLKVRITAEDGWSVTGDDLWLTVEVDPRTLRDGGRIEVETLAGPQSVWVPKGLAEPARLRLKGLGLPASGGHERGHLFLKLKPAEAGVISGARERLRRFASAWADVRAAACL